MTTPDITPSADARELYPERNPSSDYGDAQWRRKGQTGVSQTVLVDMLPESDATEQLNLFDDVAVPMPDYIRDQIKAPSDRVEDSERYGHVRGASARELKKADENFMRQQYRSS